ncbi:MAG: class I SAM-dependent methyltransferase [Collinsella sp.]|nr:class I SAM-dependent methyltransferase [Collinsella sp.]
MHGLGSNGIDGSEGGGAPKGASTPLVLLADRGVDAQVATDLALHVGAILIGSEEEAPPGALMLHMGEDGLELRRAGLALRGDLARMLPRLKPANLARELLVRAARVKPTGIAPTAIDATAGLGDDSLLLAAAGFRVTMFESDPVIAALLRDALARAARDERLAGFVGRMELIECDSIAALPALPDSPDVVYLDPMFPERSKSAAVKKKFQLLHHLERPCANQEELLRAALEVRPRKVVVKRPAKGPYLAGVKPSHSIVGKAVRYDCLVRG